MVKPDKHIRTTTYEKPTPTKNARFRKEKYFGNLIKNARLKSLIIQVTPVTNILSTTGRVYDPPNNTTKKCNRTVNFVERRTRDLSNERALSCHESVGVQPTMETEKIYDPRTKLIVYVAYSRFLKTVWKRRKEISESQNIYLESCSEQLQNLKLQIETLKSLLTSDENTIINAIREIKSLKQLLSRLQDDCTNLKSVKETLENNSEHLREELTRTLMELRNEKNNYLLAKNEALAYEVQLEKERAKISQMKNENKSSPSKEEKELPCGSKNEQQMKSNTSIEP